MRFGWPLCMMYPLYLADLVPCNPFWTIHRCHTEYIDSIAIVTRPFNNKPHFKRSLKLPAQVGILPRDTTTFDSYSQFNVIDLIPFCLVEELMTMEPTEQTINAQRRAIFEH